MNKRYKKIFSVLVAILIGAGIIFFTWRNNTINHTEDIEIADDGSWRKGLSVVPQTNLAKTLGSPRWNEITHDATTTLDIVTREMLINYTIAQKSMSTTTMSENDTNAIAQATLSKVSLPKARQYTERDLLVTSDNSPKAIIEYSEALDAVMQKFANSQTKSDIEVAFALPKAVGEAKRSSDIAQNITRYDKLIDGLIGIKTPSQFVIAHLYLIQKYANIKTMIEPLSKIFSDPIVGLSALSTYRQEVADISSIAGAFETALSKIQQ